MLSFQIRYCLLPAFLILTIPFLSNVFAQQNNDFCGTNEVYEILKQQHPEMIQSEIDQENFISNFTSKNQNKSQATYVIPVVVHIFHNYGAENIPDANVHDMLRIVNEDFQGNQPDTAQIAAPFKSIRGNLDIEFRLATKDPNGNCTDGINRIYDTVFTYQGQYINGQYIGIPPPVRWPRDQYLNIWVVNDIDNPGGFVGFSAFPNFPATIDGVTIEYTAFGSLPPSSTNNFNARYMSHEIGHSLNLFHTWGNCAGNGDPSNCNSGCDDLVGDTPNTIGHGSCANLNATTCGTLDNVQNIMDYGYGNCAGGLMFTLGQDTRAEAALNSSVGGRNNLWSQSNLIATGTDSVTYANLPICAPVADFRAPNRVVCEGSSIAFRDESYNAAYDPNTWTFNWSFPGGTPATSTDRNPVITYNTAGQYDVSLTVSNSTGSSPTVTQTNYVTINPGSGAFVGPILESATEPLWPSNSDPSLVWTVQKPQGSLFQYQRSANAYYSSPSSIYLNNFSFNNTGEFDLITPLANLTNMQAGSTFLNFQIAHSQKNNELENLFLFVSTDCGQTFTFTKVWNANIINTAPATSSPFVPQDTSEWTFVSYDLSNYAGMDNLQFMFRFNAKNGNNLWLDDIHISDSDQPVPLTVGFRQDLFGDFNLYPNPNEGLFTLEFNVTGNDKVSAEIVDMMGKSTPIEFSEGISSGWNTTTIDTRKYNLKTGIYFLKLESGDQVYSKRLMIQ